MIDIPLTKLSGDALFYACELASSINDDSCEAGDDDYIETDPSLTLADAIAIKNRIAVQYVRGTWMASGENGVGYLANEKHTAIGRCYVAAKLADDLGNVSVPLALVADLLDDDLQHPASGRG
jgi:hypothetical protein